MAAEPSGKAWAPRGLRALPGLQVPEHGGTDAGTPPRWDFSTNANPSGPAPAVARAVAEVDPRPYPDPHYVRLREVLAAAEGCRPEEVVVGAGATELMHRVVAAVPGPVVVPAAGFGEYRHAAAVCGRELRVCRDLPGFAAALDGAGVAFLAVPSSPAGQVPPAGATAEVAARATETGTALVLDLAYAPLSEVRVVVPAGAWALHSPTKAHGLTGIRAGYLRAPTDAATVLRARAPSWLLGAHGEAVLAAAASAEAQSWVAASAARLWADRADLAERLRAGGWPVVEGTANFLLAEVGDAAPVTAALREAGIRVRDTTSFGLPRHLRLAALGPRATADLVAAMAAACAR